MTTAVRPRVNIQRPVAASPAIRRLQLHSIAVEEVDPQQYRIANRFAFWPATNYWRALDNSSQGYTVGKLIDAALAAQV